MNRTDVNNYLEKIYLKIVKTLFPLLKIFPINQEKVFISNFNGQGFGCNLKAIAIDLHNRRPDLKIVWQLNNKKEIMPEWIDKVQHNSVRSYFEMATSKIWIDNCRKTIPITKRNGQFYLQTWHGFNGIKKAEGDSVEALPADYIEKAKKDSRMIDLFVSNGKFFTDTIRRAFWYNGEIIESGAPRCDILYSGKEIDKIHRYYNINRNYSLLLYAPTFRKNWQDVYDIDYNRLAVCIKEKFNKDVVILFRKHPGIKFNYDIEGENVIDVSSYPDMYELMAEADFFISDYSSSLFEFALTYKPTFIYASDVASYLGDRGFHFEIDKLPIPLAQNNDELETNINKYNPDYFQRSILEFMNKVGIMKCDKSTQIVVDRLLKVIS